MFGANEPAAAIDLRTLAVRYPPLRMIAAVEKQGEGSVRTAATLPDGRIVVSGFDFGVAGSTSLQLVNPKDWSSRALDPATSWFRVGGGMVFTRGARGTGLRILKPSGSVMELFPGRSVGSVHVVGPRAFVTFIGTEAESSCHRAWHRSRHQTDRPRTPTHRSRSTDLRRLNRGHARRCMDLLTVGLPRPWAPMGRPSG